MTPKENNFFVFHRDSSVFFIHKLSVRTSQRSKPTETRSIIQVGTETTNDP